MNLYADEITTPLGPMTVAFYDETLCAAVFRESFALFAPSLERRSGSFPPPRKAAPASITGPFAKYWQGDLQALYAIRVDPGGTPFQAKVWSLLRQIPVGQTVSYGELARAAFGGRAARLCRAVGSANAANPVAIVIPCHRVIHADGSPSGYAGGIGRKLWLLGHEGVSLPPLYRSPRRLSLSPAAGSSPGRDLHSPSAAPLPPPSSCSRPAPRPPRAAPRGSPAPSA